MRENQNKLSLFEEIKRMKKQCKKASKNPKKCKTLYEMLIHDTPSNLSQSQFKSSDSSISFINSLLKVSGDSQSQAQNESATYSWELKKFCFPLKDLQLSNKRVEILSKLIQKRNGIVTNVEDAFKDGVDYVIFNRKLGQRIISENLMRKKMRTIERMDFKEVIDFNYIIDCEKLGGFCNLQDYQIRIQLSQSPEKEKIKNFSYSQIGEPSKKIHLAHEEKNKQLQSWQTEAEEQYQSITESVKSIKSDTISLMPRLNKMKKGQKNSTQRKGNPDPQKFACQKGSSLSEFPTNQFICEELGKIQQIYENEKDVGRKIAYLKAISAVKCYDKEIISEKDIAQIRGIGSKISQKIKQLLQTGTIEKLQKLQNCEENIVCQQLTRVWGIGASKAKELYSKGIRSIQQLQGHSQYLNKNQKIGLEYLSQFEQRIPRLKVTEIFQFVHAQLAKLVQNVCLYEVQVCGSYRRGKESCGDVDIIITRKDGIYDKKIFFDLIEHLEKIGFLTDHLSLPSNKNHSENKSLSYMGVCLLKSETIHRRIDLKYYPHDQFAFAILYFTGSDMFNRSMRLFARKKGYSLSDHGICKVERNDKMQRVWEGSPICMFSEKEIFDFLGLQYKQPEFRNI